MGLIKTKVLAVKDIRDMVESMASRCREAVQDELDLGTTWDHRLDTLEKDLRYYIKEILLDYLNLNSSK